MKRNIGFVIAGLVAVGLIFFAVNSSSKKNISATDSGANPTSNSSTTGSTSSAASTTKTISAAEVSKHKTSTSCWTIIHGNVYDITSYLGQHPGGSAILAACGVDGTKYFEGDASANGQSHTHSASAQSQLDSMQIGVVN